MISLMLRSALEMQSNLRVSETHAHREIRERWMEGESGKGREEKEKEKEKKPGEQG